MILRAKNKRINAVTRVVAEAVKRGILPKVIELLPTEADDLIDEWMSTKFSNRNLKEEFRHMRIPNIVIKRDGRMYDSSKTGYAAQPQDYYDHIAENPEWFKSSWKAGKVQVQVATSPGDGNAHYVNIIVKTPLPITSKHRRLFRKVR